MHARWTRIEWFGVWPHFGPATTIGVFNRVYVPFSHLLLKEFLHTRSREGV